MSREERGGRHRRYKSHFKGMATTSQVSRSGWNGRRPRRNYVRVFVFILVAAAFFLSALSIHYSPLLTEMNDASSVLMANDARVAAAVKSDDISSVVDSIGKYAKDRVYCMVPFIWNKEIYDISKCIILMLGMWHNCMMHDLSFELFDTISIQSCRLGVRNATQ